MLFRIVSIFVFFFTLTFPASALHYESSYLEERDRIFTLPYSKRIDALEDSDVFNLNDPLGRYFHDSIRLAANDLTQKWSISKDDLLYLKANKQEYYYEKLLIDLFSDTRELEQVSADIDSIIEATQQAGLLRINRFAIQVKFEKLLALEQYAEAIYELELIVHHAPHIEQAKTTFDYPLVVILHDLALAYYLAGDGEGSLKFCKKYGNYLPDDSYVQLDSALCEARALMLLKDYHQVLKLMHPTIEPAKKADHLEVYTFAYLLIAQANYHLNDLHVAQEYSQISIDLLQDNPKTFTYELFYLHIIQADVWAKKGQPEQAEASLLKAQEVLNHQPRASRYTKIQLATKANIAVARGDYSTAYDMQKQINELETKRFSGSSLSDNLAKALQKVDQTQIKLVEEKAKLVEQRSKDLYLVSALALSFCVFCFVLFWNALKRNKHVRYWSQIDDQTQLSSRWHSLHQISYALDNIQKNRDVHTLVLFEVQNLFDLKNQHSGADTKAIKNIADIVLENVSDKDIAGRYTNESFILFNKQTYIHDAMRLAKTIKDDIYVRLHTAQMPLIIRWSLLEITHPLSIEQVISSGEELLEKAKNEESDTVLCARLTEHNQIQLVSENVLKVG